MREAMPQDAEMLESPPGSARRTRVLLAEAAGPGVDAMAQVAIKRALETLRELYASIPEQGH